MISGQSCKIELVKRKIIKNILTSNEQLSRIIIGLLMFLTITLLLYIGGYLFILVVLLISWQGNTEYLNILKAKGIQPARKWLRFISILLILTSALPTIGSSYDLPIKLFPFVILLGVTGCFFRLVLRSKNHELATIADVSATILGFIYTGLLPGFILMLREFGFAYAFVPVFCIALCDVSAYYGGKLFGKHKLKPSISPKKTLEGSLSGFIFSLIAAISFVYLFHESFQNNIIHGIMISLFCGILSQFSDLFESLLKRDAGIKDSSKVLLSHGGVLDRIDSYIFVIWAVYFYTSWFILGIF